MKTIAPNFIGTWVSGDIGPLTIYTGRRLEKIPYGYAPPRLGPSPEQLRQRARFRLAQQQWKALPKIDKMKMHAIANRASMSWTGQNLYITIALKNELQRWHALQSQTGITGPIIQGIPNAIDFLGT